VARTNNSWEIGHVNLMIDGEYSSMESFLTDSSLTEKCHSRLNEAGQLPESGVQFGIEEVISLVNGGNEVVLGVLRKVLDIILMGIDICVKAYDQYRIFLNIEWLRRTPTLRESLLHMFRKNFSGVSYGHLSVKMLEVPHLETLGAATLFFDDFFANKTTRNSLFDYCGELLKKRRK
jgi:hypothetical protein